jgi:hypothetical protein
MTTLSFLLFKKEQNSALFIGKKCCLVIVFDSVAIA